jgi:hypothetical protein
VVVDYSAISDLNSVATRLAQKFENRVVGYEGVIKRINSLPTSRDNLENDNYCIMKKNEQYQSKINKLNSFKTKMNNFSDKAQETDKRVASRITSETNAFKKANKVNISTLAAIGANLKNKGISLFTMATGITQKDVRGIKDGIKDWYSKDGNRFFVKVLKDVLIVAVIAAVVVATIASGGDLLPLLGAGVGTQLCTGFALFSGACSMGYDIAALNNYKETGDATSSRWLDKKGGSDALGAAGGGVTYGAGYALGGKELANQWKQGGEKFGKSTFSVLTIATLAYGAIKAPMSLSKDFSTIKKMGMMNGKSNWAVIGKVIKKKTFCSDFKVGFGAKGITTKINISKNLFSKYGSSKKFIFNAGVKFTRGGSKVLLGKGVIKGIIEEKDKIWKETLKIKDIQMQPSRP